MSEHSRAELTALPKAHLHLHFTGSSRLATIQDLADKHGIRLPGQLVAAWPPELSGADERGWFRFQRLYDAARACVRDEADLRRIVREAVADDADEGSRWLELQIDPTGYAAHVGGITPALEIVLDEARSVSQAGPTQVAIIVAASRTRHPLDARTLARLAGQYAGDGAGTVVGFGLSNDERRGDTASFAPAFQIARRAGLALMPHAGELLGPEAVAETLTALMPDRLGHGVRATEDLDVLRRTVDAGVAFEVCPGSNAAMGVYPSPTRVPIGTLLDLGATVALGADDPLLFGSRLVDQYLYAAASGLDDAGLRRLAECSVNASRAPEALKTQLRAEIAAWPRPTTTPDSSRSGSAAPEPN